MGYLAVARYRLLTTIRSAMPIFLVALLPAIVAGIVESTPEPDFIAQLEQRLAMNATVSLLAWLIHAAVLILSCEAMGNVKLRRADGTTSASDLMESVPIHPRERFLGEATGIFGATIIIHVCCLPLLAVAAALGPLPTRVFAWIEAAFIALLLLASAGAAWKRLAPHSKWSATRVMRSGALFFILVFCALVVSTEWETFRDSAFRFVVAPSMRTWAHAASAVDNPPLLAMLLTLLYAGYFLFYYQQSTREPAEA